MEGNLFIITFKSFLELMNRSPVALRISSHLVLRILLIFSEMEMEKIKSSTMFDAISKPLILITSKGVDVFVIWYRF